MKNHAHPEIEQFLRETAVAFSTWQIDAATLARRLRRLAEEAERVAASAVSPSSAR